MENELRWHYACPGPEDKERACREIGGGHKK